MPTGLSLRSPGRLRALLRLVTPGRVLGVFDPERRLSRWTSADPAIEFRSAGEIRRGTRTEEGKSLWIEGYGTGVPLAPLACHLRGGFVETTGVILVTDRVALLLRATDLVATFRGPDPAAHPSHRVSAPGRKPYPELRLIKPADLVQSAVLSIWVSEWSRAWRVLTPWYPGLAGEGEAMRVPLADASPEEILHRLGHAGVRVHRSVVWYPPLHGNFTPGGRPSSTGEWPRR